MFGKLQTVAGSNYRLHHFLEIRKKNRAKVHQFLRKKIHQFIKFGDDITAATSIHQQLRFVLRRHAAGGRGGAAAGEQRAASLSR